MTKRPPRRLVPPWYAVVDFRPIGQVVGTVLAILSLFRAPPMVADLSIGHPDWQVFFISGVITLFVGVCLVLMSPGAR